MISCVLCWDSSTILVLRGIRFVWSRLQTSRPRNRTWAKTQPPTFNFPKFGHQMSPPASFSPFCTELNHSAVGTRGRSDFWWLERKTVEKNHSWIFWRWFFQPDNISKLTDSDFKRLFLFIFLQFPLHRMVNSVERGISLQMTFLTWAKVRE